MGLHSHDRRGLASKDSYSRKLTPSNDKLETGEPLPERMPGAARRALDRQQLPPAKRSHWTVILRRRAR